MATDVDALRAVTLAQRPGLDDLFYPEKRRIWPEFMFHDVYAGRLWHYLDDHFADHQIYLVDADDRPVAVAQTIPLFWDGIVKNLPIGWQDCFLRGTVDVDAGRSSNTLSALEAAIVPEYRGQGVSYRLLNEVKALAARRGYTNVIVAVRPSLKHRYPLTPMQEYMRWTQADGAPLDPWLRVHWRLGGEILHMAHPSMVIDGTVDEWEAWTGMRFPASGDYVVPDALVPVHMDRVANLGRYVEPNVWVQHRLHPSRQ